MKYLLYKIGTLKVHIVLMFIFAVASYPIFCVAFSGYAATYQKYCELTSAGMALNSPEMIEINELLKSQLSTTIFVGVIGAIALIAMFATGIPILTRVFGFLHKKECADMELSAPVTFNSRFFSSFFAGLVVYLIPHIIAVLIGLAILGSDSVAVTELSYRNGDLLISNIKHVIGRMMLYGLMMCVLFYCSSALIASVCGRRGKAIKLMIFLNLAVPAITMYSGVISFEYGRGLRAGLVNEILDKTGLFTPLGILVKFFVHGVFGTKISGDISAVQMTIFLIYCALFVIVAYYLVKHRRFERTGRAYVYKYARPVVSAIAVLAVTIVIAAYLFTSLDGELPNGASAGAVAGVVAVVIIIWIASTLGFFTACEFSDSKGEKDRARRFGRFIPYLAGSALVTFLITLTQGFGAAYFVPEVNDIEHAGLDVTVGNLSLWYPAPYNDLNASEITTLHRDIISYDRGGDGDVVITYTLKDGSAYTRGYLVSDEYLKRAFDIAKNSEAEKSSYSILRDNKQASRNVRVEVSNDNIKHTSKISDPLPAGELENAIIADIREMDFDLAVKTTYKDDAPLIIHFEKYDGMEEYSVYREIYPFFKHTLAVLEQYGFAYSDIF